MTATGRAQTDGAQLLLQRLCLLAQLPLELVLRELKAGREVSTALSDYNSNRSEFS